MELRGPGAEGLGSEAGDSLERLMLEKLVQLFLVGFRVVEVARKLR